jgi:homoserine dehydrogenase
MTQIDVLKFGSSVLRSPEDLPVAVDEIYRHWRSGSKVLAVVSALDGVTDQLIKEAETLFATTESGATAAYIAQGEQRTGALLLASLMRCGMSARLVEPRDIGLIAEGSPLESTPVSVDVTALGRFWNRCPILILPGFYGVDTEGSTVLFGRGGSDLSALFLASELGVSCRLLKDVSGVYDADPASSKLAHRFTALSWETAVKVAGPLIQAKGLRHAQSAAMPFCVGRPNEEACTRVGNIQDEWEAPGFAHRPMRVVLLGCGVVGRGVYEILKRHPRTFEIAHVVVRDVDDHFDIPERTSDVRVAAINSIDIVVECFGGTTAYPAIEAALAGGKFVVTANKALVAAYWAELSPYVHAMDRQLWYSAAVGGALPALETLQALKVSKKSIVEVRGIINGTCGVVLDARSEGKTMLEAIALAKEQGFSEADPTRDLSGQDSADKLALMIEAAFGEWLPPESIAVRGIDGITGDPTGCKLMARARKTQAGIVASVAPEVPPPTSFLWETKGAENRIEIELKSGEVIRLKGQGAGRWPTAVSVLGDLHEVARLAESRSWMEAGPEADIPGLRYAELADAGDSLLTQAGTGGAK